MTIELTNIPDVEILETGEFACASGVHTFTSDDLTAAVAALDDPGIKEPRLKLGHVGEHGETGVAIGQPVFGKFTNLRVENEGQLLKGDIVGVPSWLADILPVAYPARSIEGQWNVRSATGKVHRFVITAVACLGVELPGVATLEDLQILFEEGEGAELAETSASQVVAEVGRPVPASASVDAWDIRMAYYDTAPFSHWIHELYVSPMELIVEDETDGQLYRVTYTVSDEEEVEFADPTPVKKEYIDVEARAGRPEPALVFASRAESRPKEGSSVDLSVIEALRKRLGLSEEELPDDVDDAAVTALLEAEPEGGGEEESAVETEGEGEPASEGEEEPESESEGEPTVTVPASAWQEMQSQVARLATKDEEQSKSSRSRILQDAVKAGKVFPAQQKYYTDRLEDPNTRDSFVHLLTASVKDGGLAPDLVPVKERGVSGSESENITLEGTGLFPELMKNKES